MFAPPGAAPFAAPPIPAGPPPGPQFPSLDPQALMSSAAPIAQLQEQDQQSLVSQQDSLLAMVLSAMKQMPNPAGQAAMTLPAPPQAASSDVSMMGDQGPNASMTQGGGPTASGGLY